FVVRRASALRDRDTLAMTAIVDRMHLALRARCRRDKGQTDDIPLVTVLSFFRLTSPVVRKSLIRTSRRRLKRLPIASTPDREDSRTRDRIRVAHKAFLTVPLTNAYAFFVIAGPRVSRAPAGSSGSARGSAAGRSSA